ncbi:MAG: hypothetical protein ACE5NA_00885 [Nitrospiraceae bacterium]
MSRETLLAATTIVAIVAALLTIIDRSLSLRKRFQIFRRRYASAKKEKVLDRKPSALIQWFTSLEPPIAHLFLYEILIIAATGVMLNYLGLVLSVRLESILYLDMMGTAFAAILLGPWWGASVALLSNSVVNWLLYPEPNADLAIFPWALVNMAGGFFWGMMARRPNFRKYLSLTSSSAMPHLRYLLSFGVLGALVMSIPGTFVQAALSEQTMFTLNPDLLSTFERYSLGSQQRVRDYLEVFLGLAWADSFGWATVNWVQNFLRYIPDKTMSVAIALIILKYGFPLFERELVHGGPTGQRPTDDRLAPLFLGLLYAPSYAALLTTDMYMGSHYWPLWTAPWLFIVRGYGVLNRAGLPEATVREARIARSRRYAWALKPIEQEPDERFCQRLVLATLIASAVIVLCMPFLLVDYYSVAFNFFFVVYGFLLAVHLVRMAIAQNIAMARLGNPQPVEPPNGESQAEPVVEETPAEKEVEA